MELSGGLCVRSVGQVPQCVLGLCRPLFELFLSDEWV